MKKKIISLLLAGMAVSSITACGARTAMANEGSLPTSTTETMTETDGNVSTENIVEPVYTETFDLFLADNYREVNREKLEAVDMDSLERTYQKYALSEGTDVYNSEGNWLGYTKPDIEVILFGTNDKWAEVSFMKMVLYMPKEIFESIATPKAGLVLYRDEPEEETMEEVPSSDIQVAAADKEEAPKQEEAPASVKPKTDTTPTANEPVSETPASEAPAVEENTKYTPEEAIAVYRSIMEANGIQWDPSLVNGASWGTGFLYLDKGYPEWAGNSSVEAFRMGDTVGNSWEYYYLEITGSDENTVYVTEWHS